MILIILNVPICSDSYDILTVIVVQDVGFMCEYF